MDDQNPKPEDRGAPSERSSRTNHSGSSSHSSHGSAVRARAKAEAARVKATFAQRQADMLIEQAWIEAEQSKKKALIEAEQQCRAAELQANLDALKVRSAVEAACAEAEILEAYEDEVGEPSRQRVTGLAPYSSQQHTSKYVQQHSVDHGQQQLQPPKQEAVYSRERQQNMDNGDPVLSPKRQQNMDNGDTEMHGMNVRSCAEKSNSFHSLHKLQGERQNRPTTHSQQSRGSPVKFPQERCFPQQLHFAPSQDQQRRHQCATNYMPSRDQSVTSDLAKYLIRKEIVSASLLMFDDRPENYWAWKAAFITAIGDLNLSHREELDLLSKWLGPKSAELAKRIRSVHIHDATEGLLMLWRRLEECYGSAEVIENAMLKRLGEFPRIANKDNQKLQELGDLLLELEAARRNGFLPGLSYLNTPRGVNPIAQKLPYYLLEKWISFGSKYKEDFRVQYPPFHVFVQYIQDQAKIRNDPSFAGLGGSYRTDKLQKEIKQSVFARKTDVSNADAGKQNKKEKRVEDPALHPGPAVRKPESSAVIEDQGGEQEEKEPPEVEMELKSESNQQNYWMIQYQRLLDAKPLSLRMQEAGVEKELVNLLCKLSAQHYLPIMAHHRVTTEALRHMNPSDLKKLGINEIGIQKALLKWAQEHLPEGACKMVEQSKETEVIPSEPSFFFPPIPDTSSIMTPSPPVTPGTPITPSAPSPVEGPGGSECVVCMETTAQVIFLPCGHVCCCQVCSGAMQNCPLCRSALSQRIRLYHS
ncbi:E3 ubiquitin-protein ligase LRSAM1 isoform X1 [Entelurus aequoreus]|uniref:E3 ubiquitin-protein ligase LRSAM1 isoform X1 n=1 Tax=Entelurus aequoreus TaxID=161455 RepID=UPI002B1E2503|nr:E3 ubiquitin-protein ligase LRSAM1 isoform X1 [Entelurus aequoreus]